MVITMTAMTMIMMVVIVSPVSIPLYREKKETKRYIKNPRFHPLFLLLLYISALFFQVANRLQRQLQQLHVAAAWRSRVDTYNNEKEDM